MASCLSRAITDVIVLCLSFPVRPFVSPPLWDFCFLLLYTQPNQLRSSLPAELFAISPAAVVYLSLFFNLCEVVNVSCAA